VEAADYEAWGEANRMKAGVELPGHGYVGAERDPAFGFYTYGVRVYDPSLRRWFSPEPEWLTQGPIGLNPYQYANNNPVRFVDLDGRVVVLPRNNDAVMGAQNRAVAGSDSYRKVFDALNERQDIVVFVTVADIPPDRRPFVPPNPIKGDSNARSGEPEFGLIEVRLNLTVSSGPDSLLNTLAHEFCHVQDSVSEALTRRDAARAPEGSAQRESLEKWARGERWTSLTKQKEYEAEKWGNMVSGEVSVSEARRKGKDGAASAKKETP
jgi:RHS repeat-associated protein